MKLCIYITLLPSLPNSWRYIASTLHFQRFPVLGESEHFINCEYLFRWIPFPSPHLSLSLSLSLSLCYTLWHTWEYQYLISQNEIALKYSITCILQITYVMNIIIVHNTGQHLFLVNDFTVSIIESLHVLYYVL